MKPHEETWEALHNRVRIEGTNVEIASFDWGSEPNWVPDQRAQLAAQAPAMARVLLALYDRTSAIPDNDVDVEEVLREAGVLPAQHLSSTDEKGPR